MHSDHTVYISFPTHGCHCVRGERIGTGFHTVLSSTEVSQIVVQEADLPDLVVDLADAHELLCQRRTQVDLATAHADAAAACVVIAARINGPAIDCGLLFRLTPQ